MTSTHPNDSIEPDKQIEMTVGDYVVSESIGQGSFAIVYKAQHKSSHRTVAIKSVSRSKLTKKLQENLESEISILKAIRHDHIVGLIECQNAPKYIHLIMEYCSVGDLSQYIRRIRGNKAVRGPAGGLPEPIVRCFLKQLASALQFLRSQDLVHRDIKPQNLLLVLPQEHPNPRFRESEIPVLKVADFGFARFLPNATLADTLCGSPLYMGPEILAYKKYDAKADLWSVGAVLYEMITGKPPFRAHNHLELLKMIQENQDRIHFPGERQYPSSSSMHDPRAEKPSIVIGEDLKDLIRKLLKQEPVERISFEEFFMHPAVFQPPATRSTSQSPGHGSNTTTGSSGISISRSTSRSTLRLSEPLPSSLPSSSSLTSTLSNKARYPSPASYEPPPFAHPVGGLRHTLERRGSSHGVSRAFREEKKEEGKSRRTSISNGMRGHGQDISSKHNPIQHHLEKLTKGEPEEDVLHGYVVLDRKLIETNQFADDLDGRTHKDSSSSSSHQGSHGHEASGATHVTPLTIARERKISTGAAGSALAKALSMASVRLFGVGSSPTHVGKLPLGRVGSPKGFLTAVYSEPSPSRMARIEYIACMAHAVACLADNKFDALKEAENEKRVAEEALILHIKALALLEQGMDSARQYWTRISEDQVQLVSARLNTSVQWMRDRFNECLDRASLEGSKCEKDQGSACVEKLLYDCALDMSRTAAVHELVGENIAECEQDYQTAIWLLAAILQSGEDEPDMEEEDRRIINKFVDSIRHRIAVLRKKMEKPTEDRYH
ncbi:kinase-like domain-containing protein [Spinellus fusiger]|nr:kinase-like domain-containing protein [Spinellus fusiger]